MTDDHPPKNPRPQLEEFWKYKESSRVKHLFFMEGENYAECGQGRPWWKDNDWKTDEDGLDKRRMCKRCKVIKTLNEYERKRDSEKISSS